MKTWPRAFILLVAVGLVAGCQNGADDRLTGSWQLASGSLNGEALELADARRPITLELTERGVSGVSGCNDYTGWAHIEGSRLDLSRIGGTDMGCAPEAMELEEAYLEALRRVARGEPGNGQLRLAGPGVNLVFEATTTPDPSVSSSAAWSGVPPEQAASAAARMPAKVLLCNRWDEAVPVET